MKVVALRYALTALFVLTASTGCVFAKESPYPVNAGDSTPVAEREDGDNYARIIDRTPIVAFEYGRCETDDDCAPRGCDNAVCSPDGYAATCISDQVSHCLAEVPRTSCGCTDEGVCRWARDMPVLQCARIYSVDGGETRSYPGSEGEAYPWRPYY